MWLFNGATRMIGGGHLNHSREQDIEKTTDLAHLFRWIKSYNFKNGEAIVRPVIQDIANTGVSLAILPAGSGNDTARMFRLTTQPDQFVKGLLKHQTVAIDLLNINDRYGFTVAGVGLDAMIGKRVNQSFYKPFLE